MKKFYLESYGCKLNESDSEILKSILKKEYEETSEKEADFIVLNTCGVIDRTEEKILRKTKDLQLLGKKVFWAGCLPLISRKNIADGSIGPSNLDDILLAVKREEHITSRKNMEKPLLCKSRRKDSGTAIVAISEGCPGNCSYCGSKLARGYLHSFSKESILKEINEVLEAGFKEILLTSQGLASYNLEKGSLMLPELVSDILKIKKDFRLRLGMMNPNFALKIIDDLIPLFKDDRLYNFLHLPIQSGSDKLLKEMNRGYSKEDFLNIVEKFRSLKGDTVLATDIIVGHPKEDEEDFQETIELVKRVKPEVLHIFRYSKRKGTADALLEELDSRIKKQRSRELTKIYKEYNLKENKKFLGRKVSVLVVRKEKDSYLSRMDSGRAVVLNEGSIGERITVQITDCRWNYLVGSFI